MPGPVWVKRGCVLFTAERPRSCTPAPCATFTRRYNRLHRLSFSHNQDNLFLIKAFGLKYVLFRKRCSMAWAYAMSNSASLYRQEECPPSTCIWGVDRWPKTYRAFAPPLTTFQWNSSQSPPFEITLLNNFSEWPEPSPITIELKRSPGVKSNLWQCCLKTYNTHSLGYFAYWFGNMPCAHQYVDIEVDYKWRSVVWMSNATSETTLHVIHDPLVITQCKILRTLDLSLPAFRYWSVILGKR